MEEKDLEDYSIGEYYPDLMRIVSESKDKRIKELEETIIEFSTSFMYSMKDNGETLSLTTMNHFEALVACARKNKK